MQVSHSFDAIAVTFDDERLVANAGLVSRPRLASAWGCGSCSSPWSTWATPRAGPTWAARP